ncbi:MAG: hypothetical protein PVH76_09170 [Myxococcales bacterium]|jgi:hypothetical protein
MKRNRMLSISAMALVSLLAVGCKSKGPVPAEDTGANAPAKVGSTEMGGAHPAMGTENPHAGMQNMENPHAGMQEVPNPHAGMMQPSGGFGEPDGSGMIDVGAISFKLPDDWSARPPKSSMRRAELTAPGSAGNAELIVYFFGEQGAGSAKANIDRWVGQFSKPDGSPVSNPKQTSSKVSGFDVTRLDVTGNYAGGMGPAGQQLPPQSDQRLIATIVETPGGPYYFKLVGPSATVAENTKAFNQLIESIVPSS